MALGTSHDLATGVLDATSSLLIVTEPGTGVVVAINRAAEELTGFRRADVIGLPLWEIASPAHREMLERALRDPSGQGLPASFESTVNLRSGKPRRILWSNTFLTDDAGVHTHVVMTGIDMSSDAASGGLFAHLMESANSTALISTDRRGRVTYCSSGAERLLGLEGSRLVGQQMPLDMFDESELRERAAQYGVAADLGVLRATDMVALVSSGAGGLRGERDWTLTRDDGSRLIASIAITAARDYRGRHVGYVGIAHDVTERRNAHRVLTDALVANEKAVERLHELDRAKSEFVATVSHELRTPTTNIVGSAELLVDGLAGDLTGEQRVLVESIARNSQRLVTLADDLVTLARVDAGDLDLDLADIDLRDVVREARDALQPLLLDRDLETSVELPSAPVHVRGDSAHLARAIFNLVSNAVKFTDDGGSISCRLAQDDGDAVLEVSDSGIGIPHVEQRDLFTRFFRSSTSQERATQGSGLGLSIVSSIVHEHGGQIFVDSEHMQGCTFTVRIPLVAAHLADQPADQAAGNAA